DLRVPQIQRRTGNPVVALVDRLRLHRMRVRGHFGGEKRDRILAARLSEVVCAQAESGLIAADVDRDRALQIRQREGALAVAAVCRAEQREESGVLRDRQDLPVAPGPASRREVEGEDADLCDKWV